MRIRVAYHNIRPNGYCEFARVFVEALRRKSQHEVVMDHLVVGHKKSPASNGAEVNVIVSTPEHFAGQKLSGAKNLGYTMWEASRIRADWAEACNLMDVILVPAQSSKDALIHSGVMVPIHIVPPFVDASNFPSRKHTGVFTFLSIFQWVDRKDPGSLLRAFWQEFTDQDNVRLVIKTWPFFGESNQQIASDVEAVRREIGLSSYAKVEVLSYQLTRPALENLHASADCYVSAHHGEGWGMPLMDAMAMGTPCIATRYGGNLAYMTDLNSALVDVEAEVPAVQRNSWLRSVYEDSTWAQVDLTDLRRKMRAMVNNENGCQMLGQLAKHDMTRLTAENTVRLFEAALS